VFFSENPNPSERQRVQSIIKKADHPSMQNNTNFMQHKHSLLILTIEKAPMSYSYRKNFISQFLKKPALTMPKTSG